MAKFLSFTTALVSLVALGSVSSFADDKSSDVAKENTIVIKNAGASSMHSGQKKSAKSNKGHNLAKAKHDVKKPAPVIMQPAVSEKDMEQQLHKKEMFNSGRPKVYLGGVVDAFYYYAAPEDGYKIGSAFNNIGVPGAETGVPGTINVKDTLPISTGPTGIKNYYDDGRPTPANYADYSRNWGAEANAALQFKIQGQNRNTGILYGVVADVSLNGVGSVAGGPSPFHTNGTYLFASSNYGTLSMGYQEGPETSMRIDASNISVGDMGLGSNWYKFANLEGRDGTVPFLLAPGLYTESFLAGTNSMGQFVDRLDVLMGKDRVDSSMPFRFSYQSPIAVGFRVGVGYAPRYNSKGFTGDYNEGFAQLGTGDPFDSSIAPYYKNIFSGGLTYQYTMSDMNLSVSAVGEFGTAVKHDDDLAKGNLYSLFVEGEDLRSFGIGAKVGYAGIDFVASFATLGKSGVISDVYTFTQDMIPGSPPTAIPNTGHMAQGICPDTNGGNNSIGSFCNLYKTDESSYYFTLGAGYKYQDAYLSATFFRSKAYDKNELRHFALGAQYNLAYGRTVFAPYISWNYFWTEQSDALDVSDKYYGVGSGTNETSILNGFQPHQNDNKGSVLIAGVRFLFS